MTTQRVNGGQPPATSTRELRARVRVEETWNPSPELRSRVLERAARAVQQGEALGVADMAELGVQPEDRPGALLTAAVEMMEQAIRVTSSGVATLEEARRALNGDVTEPGDPGA